MITDDAANVVWRMDYYPFGEDRALSGRLNFLTAIPQDGQKPLTADRHSD